MLLTLAMQSNFFVCVQGTQPSGAQLHTLSKLYDVPVCFVHPLFWGYVLLYVRSPGVAVARYRMICLGLVDFGLSKKRQKIIFPKKLKYVDRSATLRIVRGNSGFSSAQKL